MAIKLGRAAAKASYKGTVSKAGDLTRKIATKGAMSNLGVAGKAFSSNLSAAGGLKAVAGTMGRSALGGAAIGAVGGLARGEDPWEGAAKGSIAGAALGGGIKGTRMGAGLPKGQGFASGINQFNKQYGVSDSVKTLLRTEDAIRVGKNVFGKAKGRVM